MGKPVQDHAAILAKALGAQRVLVKTDTGKQKYRQVDELADTDVIQTKSDGLPIVMKGKPGRKKKINPEPANDTVKAILAKREEHLAADKVLQSARKDTGEDTLGAIIIALGEEQASLAFVRQEMQRQGNLADTAGISSRRVQGLRAMADTLQKRMDRSKERNLNTDSPAFHAYFSHVMSTFKEAMSSVGYRPEEVETVFAKFAGLTSDPTWEAEAKARIRSAV